MTDSDRDKLGERIGAARKLYIPEEENGNRAAERNGPLAFGMRVLTEMIGVVLGGGLIGWLLDKWLGTSPICLMAFVFLGICAGFYNIYKLTRNFGTGIGIAGLPPAPKNATQSRHSGIAGEGEDGPAPGPGQK